MPWWLEGEREREKKARERLGANLHGSGEINHGTCVEVGAEAHGRLPRLVRLALFRLLKPVHELKRPRKTNEASAQPCAQFQGRRKPIIKNKAKSATEAAPFLSA